MKQKIILRILTIVLLVLIIFLLYMMYNFKTNAEEAEIGDVALSGNLQEEQNIENEEELIEEDENELVTQEYIASDGNTYEVIAVLNIPSLGIEYPVLSTTSTELLKVSINKYWGPNPNCVGNLCILGHNYNDSRFFGKLNKIQNGDIIQLTDMKGRTLNYSVYDTYIVNPDNTDCTSQITNGRTEITLITCTSTGKQRFVVKAVAERDRLNAYQYMKNNNTTFIRIH